jgi:hypothetical protein
MLLTLRQWSQQGAKPCQYAHLSGAAAAKHETLRVLLCGGHALHWQCRSSECGAFAPTPASTEADATPIPDDEIQRYRATLLPDRQRVSVAGLLGGAVRDVA